MGGASRRRRGNGGRRRGGALRRCARKGREGRPAGPLPPSSVSGTLPPGRGFRSSSVQRVVGSPGVIGIRIVPRPFRSAPRRRRAGPGVVRAPPFAVPRNSITTADQLPGAVFVPGSAWPSARRGRRSVAASPPVLSSSVRSLSVLPFSVRASLSPLVPPGFRARVAVEDPFPAHRLLDPVRVIGTNPRGSGRRPRCRDHLFEAETEAFLGHLELRFASAERSRPAEASRRPCRSAAAGHAASPPRSGNGTSSSAGTATHPSGDATPRSTATPMGPMASSPRRSANSAPGESSSKTGPSCAPTPTDAGATMAATAGERRHPGQFPGRFMLFRASRRSRRRYDGRHGRPGGIRAGSAESRGATSTSGTTRLPSAETLRERSCGSAVPAIPPSG